MFGRSSHTSGSDVAIFCKQMASHVHAEIPKSFKTLPEFESATRSSLPQSRLAIGRVCLDLPRSDPIASSLDPHRMESQSRVGSLILKTEGAETMEKVRKALKRSAASRFVLAALIFSSLASAQTPPAQSGTPKE